MGDYGKADEFLRKLIKLCVEYNADFYYTTDDDGVHVDIDGERIDTGQLDIRGFA